MPYLQVLDLQNDIIALPDRAEVPVGWEFRIGRAGGRARSDLQLKFAESTVSGLHAVITCDGRNYYIEDQHSTNNTYLFHAAERHQKEHVCKEFQKYRLTSGDVIKLGSDDVRLRFQDGPILIGPSAPGIVDNPALELTIVPGETITEPARQELVDAILEISRTLASTLGQEEMAARLLSQMTRIFIKGQRFLLFATVTDSNRLRLLGWKLSSSRRRIFSNSGYEDDLPRYSRTIHRMVVEERKAVILMDTDREIAHNESIPDMGIRSIMCAPIEAPDGRVLGMLQIDADQLVKFQRSELEILKVIAQQVGATMQMGELHRQAIQQTRLKAEMKNASEIARHFLPPGVPNIPGFEFYAEYHPAEDIGGDYYDFYLERPGHVVISSCDVVGHGVPAALIMARLSSDLRNCLRQESDPAAVLEMLDQVMTPVLNPSDTSDCKFISMAVASLDLKTARLTLTNGGHPAVLIRRRDGRLETPDLGLSGHLVGIDFGEDYKSVNPYHTTQVQLEPGDVVIYYSDGLSEARNQNGVDFAPNPEIKKNGDYILGNVIRQTSGGPVAVGKAIMKAFQIHSLNMKQEDDVTLVCFGPKLQFVPES